MKPAALVRRTPRQLAARVGGSTVATLRAAAGLGLELVRVPLRRDPDGWENFREDLAHTKVGFKEMVGERHGAREYQDPVSRVLLRGNRLDGDTAYRLSPSDFAHAVERLKTMGAGSIVDLRAEPSREREIAHAAGIPFHSINVVDNWHPTFKQVRQFLDLVSDPANQPVYVHCQAGVGRTGVMVACYRMVVEGWTSERALAEMVTYTQSPVRPNQAAFVRSFERAMQNNSRGLTEHRLERWRRLAR